MKISPYEKEKLLLWTAGKVAIERKERGVKLNYPETIAYISHWLLESARDGKSVAELMSGGRELLTVDDVMPGVDTMIESVQIEASFPDGTKMVTVSNPIQ